MTLGEKVKLKREELNLSQEELAEKMNYKSKTSIHKIEVGITDLPLSKVKELAAVLKTTPAYLMGWENKKEENNIFSQLTEDELAKLEKFKNMSTVMFMNEGNDISDKDKETLAIAYAEVLISQRKK
ncbi:putative toxin-antitoxin system, antitoxin component, Xre family [Fusobacterium animalis 11_3_2]|uniref:Toxin-antitoxin system, antitoxin component, Xre family n=1 Tax=Fusobacterium animalis 11_3_2 TaxID=457403 RepID=F7L1A3_9FUSO|nr:helix-turn-helix transcriptional regulator [Fusobacterium animalis]EGN66655.1 putative toxin-antitoxin system, antitoxin component, Xre family [Fusobacterium animalis 11_3_2]